MSLIGVLVLLVVWYCILTNRAVRAVACLLLVTLIGGLGYMFWQLDSHVWFWALVIGCTLAVLFPLSD